MDLSKNASDEVKSMIKDKKISKKIIRHPVKLVIMLTKEENPNIQKLKIFSGRDFDKIKMGIDLVKFNNKNIYNEFLNEVSLEKGWNDIVGLNSNSTFKHDWGTNDQINIIIQLLFWV